MALDYFKKKVSSSNIDKKQASKFMEVVKRYAKITGTNISTDEKFNKFMATLPVEIRTAYPDEYKKFLNFQEVKGTEKKYGSITAEMIDELVDPDIAEERYQTILEQVKEEPTFKKYFDSLKSEMADQQMRTEQDIDKYTRYAEDDYVKNLAKTDQYIADALQQAVEGYGMKGTLGSTSGEYGMEKIVNRGSETKEDLATQQTRLLDKYSTEKLRNEETYKRNLDKLAGTEYLTASQIAQQELGKVNNNKLDQLMSLIG